MRDNALYTGSNVWSIRKRQLNMSGSVSIQLTDKPYSTGDLSITWLQLSGVLAIRFDVVILEHLTTQRWTILVDIAIRWLGPARID